MQYWLLKSEPESYSWQQMQQDKVTSWNGVRNFQARNNMKLMKNGDLAFFYHSVKGKAVIGIVKVVKEYYPDPTDETGKFGMVDVEYVRSLAKPVLLKDIKEDPTLEGIALVKQSRLSVMPLTENEWQHILNMGR